MFGPLLLLVKFFNGMIEKELYSSFSLPLSATMSFISVTINSLTQAKNCRSAPTSLRSGGRRTAGEVFFFYLHIIFTGPSMLDKLEGQPCTTLRSGPFPLMVSMLCSLVHSFEKMGGRSWVNQYSHFPSPEGEHSRQQVNRTSSPREGFHPYF